MAWVLVVDDEEGVREFLMDALEQEGRVVKGASGGGEALTRLAERSYQVVVTDLRMPGIDGLTLLERIRREHPETEVVVLTAHGTVETAVQAMKLGAFDFLQKPLKSPAEARLVVERALERYRASAAREAARPDEVRLSHGAPAMVPVVDALRRVAATDATVLLLGESGTGKEEAARAVHRWSARKDGPFVAVNCAALSESLLESELFGHEKGAFTGAVARRRGKLELADGGTFFLDEVGELRPSLQAKLLRVLQERSFERVGGHQQIGCDVRWVAATNRDLGAMMAEGTFREDLYHRLGVFPVHLPPLRERREDIPALAEALLGRVAAQLKRPRLRLTPEALTALGRRAWPGNVRELANALERAAILSDGEALTPELFGPEPRHAAHGSTHPPPHALAPGAPHVSAPGVAAGGAPGAARPAAPVLTMVEAEREAIQRALAHCDGNRKKAAEQLGIGLRTLYEKLQRYGLGLPGGRQIRVAVGVGARPE